MKKSIELGSDYKDETKFTLPLEFVTRTLAIIGIRGSGKTIAATVLAEEMSECGLPWVALDPVGTFWGLRADKDGQPGGYPVLILGGSHGDLPITKNMGRSIAEAILEQNISCVIDLSGESKTTWRYFVTEFCDRLMELKPSVPRHIFLEETPEFCPQRPLGEQRRSLAAVDRLIRLGRNRGYGATLISQRFATINKDVLTQCESLLALRSIGKPDRKAVEQWIAECATGGPSGDTASDAETFLGSLTRLEDGVGWFWSPQWLHEFQQIRIRRRKTYHPGETRTPGQIAKQVNISDLDQFVHKFKIVLESIQKGTEVQPKRGEPQKIHMILENPPVESIMEKALAEAQAEIQGLKEENAKLTREVLELSKRRDRFIKKVQKIKEYFKTDYERLKELFDDDSDEVVSSIDASVYDVWKHKLGPGPGKIIDALISRDGNLTRIQIRTLTGMAERTFQNYLAKLHSNGLVKKDGKLITLMVP